MMVSQAAHVERSGCTCIEAVLSFVRAVLDEWRLGIVFGLSVSLSVNQLYTNYADLHTYGESCEVCTFA